MYIYIYIYIIQYILIYNTVYIYIYIIQYMYIYKKYDIHITPVIQVNSKERVFVNSHLEEILVKIIEKHRKQQKLY